MSPGIRLAADASSLTSPRRPPGTLGRVRGWGAGAKGLEGEVKEEAMAPAIAGAHESSRPLVPATQVKRPTPSSDPCGP